MLIAGIDTLDANADAVTLMTLHNAKGLEFPVVFITGLEDGLFPLSQAFDDPDKLEEERRLFYVGITRAERKLYLSFAEQRRRNGELMMSIKSRFLKDIPAGMLDEKRTIKVRSSGRSSFLRDRPADSGFGQTSWRGAGPVRRALDVPSWKASPEPEAAEAGSGYVTGERIRHKLFGAGKITELSGTGRDVKAVIEFDDAAVGRKTIKLAYTTLEKGQS
jgi:DNA helicase-2/ATP-dependent DNA helicase PcrA